MPMQVGCALVLGEHCNLTSPTMPFVCNWETWWKDLISIDKNLWGTMSQKLVIVAGLLESPRPYNKPILINEIPYIEIPYFQCETIPYAIGTWHSAFLWSLFTLWRRVGNSFCIKNLCFSVWWTGGGKANTNGYLPCAIKNTYGILLVTELNNGTSLLYGRL